MCFLAQHATGAVTQPNNKTNLVPRSHSVTGNVRHSHWQSEIWVQDYNKNTELIFSTENHWCFAYKRAAAISRKRIRTTLRSVRAASIGKTLVFNSFFTCVRDIGNFGTSQGLCKGCRNNLWSQYSYIKKNNNNNENTNGNHSISLSSVKLSASCPLKSLFSLTFSLQNSWSFFTKVLKSGNFFNPALRHLYSYWLDL